MTPHKRVPAWRTFTPELIANVQYRYEETDEPVAHIAADMGIHPGSLRRIAYKRGWVRHKNLGPRDVTPAMRLLLEAQKLEQAQASPRPEPALAGHAVHALAGGGDMAPAPAAREDDDGPDAKLTAIDRMEQAVLNELASVEAMRAQFGPEPYKPQDAERTARTLSNLTETLGKLQRMRAGLPSQERSAELDDDDMPEDIDAFRFELARRINAWVDSRSEEEGSDGAIEAPAR